MPFRVANCPVSWAIEEADAETNVPWTRYLDDAAAAGYQGVELGPIGYLPREPEALREALAARNLDLSAGYVMEPLARPEARDDVLSVTRETCSVLRACGASVLILIDDMYPERSAVAGRTDQAERLSTEGMSALVAVAEEASRIASGEFGLTVAFHPHVGTYVEYRDEIDAFFGAADPELVGLCVDTGHSVYAGVDPVALFAEHRERVRYMHLKDVREEILERSRSEELGFDAAVEAGIFCPVGAGMVDYAALAREAAGAGFEWVAVEQDRAPGGSYPVPPLADATESFDYLTSLELAATT